MPESSSEKNSPLIHKQIYETHFEQQKKEILQLHPGRLLLDEKEVFFGNGVGKSASYQHIGDMAGKIQPLISELFLYTRGDWFLKFRITTPHATYSRAKHDIRKIIRAIKQDIELKG